MIQALIAGKQLFPVGLKLFAAPIKMSLDPHSERSTIWFTGFYEGEGTVVNDKGNRNAIRVSIAQNDRTPLDLGVIRWGGFVRPRVRKSPASEKICYSHEWVLTGKKAIMFLADIEQFMIIPYKINQLARVRAISETPWDEKFKCNFCDLEYTDPSGRRRHEVKEHISKGQVFSCEKCPRTYKSKASLTRHKRINHQINASLGKVLGETTQLREVPEDQATTHESETVHETGGNDLQHSKNA